MKKSLLYILLIFVLAFTVAPSQALACAMKLTPDGPSATIGDIVTLRLELALTHRTCVLPIEQTVIKLTGGEIIDPGVWKKGNPNVLEFKVRFTQPGDAIVRIERNCSKDGLHTVETKVKVSSKPGTAAASVPVVSVPGAPTATASSAVAASPATASAPEKSDRSLSWQQALTAWWPAYAEHFLSWLAVFSTGLILYLGKQHSLRKPLLLFSLLLTGFYLGGCPGPVGSWYYLLTGNRGVMGLVLFLLLVPILFSLFWGRIFCGWMCPIGAAQELISIKRFRFKMPTAVDQPLKKLKYVLLAGFSLITLWTGVNYFGHHEPFKTLFNFDGSALSFVLLALVLAWSIVTERPFCRYICPLGAILAITSRCSRCKVTPDRGSCVHCHLCAKSGCCPTGALRMDSSGPSALPVIDAAECIHCGKCGLSCPRNAISDDRTDKS